MSALAGLRNHVLDIVLLLSRRGMRRLSVPEAPHCVGLGQACNRNWVTLFSGIGIMRMQLQKSSCAPQPLGCGSVSRILCNHSLASRRHPLWLQ